MNDNGSGREVTSPALLSTQSVSDVETRSPSSLVTTRPGTLPAAVVRFEGACEVIGGLLFVLLAVAVFLLLWVYTADPACWSAE